MALRTDTGGELLTTAANAPSGDFTASFWVYVPALPSDWRVVWGIGGNTTTNASGHSLWVSPTNTFLVYTTPNTLTVTGPAVSAATWTHVALVGNTGATQAWSLWVNGTEYTGTSGGSGYVNGPTELLGSSDGAGSTLFARVAAYKHWTVKLVANQVQSERWCYLPRYGNSLYCVAPLFHTSYLSDYSGNGNDFSASGTLATEEGPAITLGAGFTAGMALVTAVASAGANYKPVYRGRRR